MNVSETHSYAHCITSEMTHLLILKGGCWPNQCDEDEDCRIRNGWDGRITSSKCRVSRSNISKHMLIRFANLLLQIENGSDIYFYRDDGGKLYWGSESERLPYFSMSYSYDFVAVAICPLGAVGCDIELNREIDNCDRLALRFFPDLVESFRALNLIEGKNESFLERWCLLESFAKCGGEGLAHWLGRVKFGKVGVETRLARSCTMLLRSGLVASVTWADPALVRLPLVVWDCELDDRNELAFVPHVRLPIEYDNGNLANAPESFRFWLPLPVD